MKAKYNVSYLILFLKFETQLRLLRTDRKGLLGGVVQVVFATTVACCRFPGIELYSTHG